MHPGDLVIIRGPKGNGNRFMATGIIIEYCFHLGPALARKNCYLVYVNGTSEVYHKCYLELVV
jgi:hypothetical protein